ncbi:MAG: hypothetical protein IT557_17610 [Alphaproteobacteria bacterium]|nr:hypothetical protein [Alphaproteobacteria bacterium]
MSRNRSPAWPRLILAGLLLLALAAPLAACGKRGQPLPPEGSGSTYPRSYPTR